ncbi:conserved hypothetical protein [Ricinus communis]|uniref:Uncharacterized protein n=1 Tax=Ricinus communis TaxID=3988 RepID=B9RNM7_RICCO|nr:conserved hypothetical protein [Ricinus communis]
MEANIEKEILDLRRRRNRFDTFAATRHRQSPPENNSPIPPISTTHINFPLHP